MHSPHAAIAWQFWRPYRWWLAAGVAYLVPVSAACRLVPPGATFNAVAWFLASPLALGALAMLAVFSYGSGMDLEARESGFPRRLLTLPVSSRALAGWPMLYGGLAMATVWIATAGLILRPRGVDAPLWWPALFAAGFLAWFQALCWSPFPLPWLRLPAAVGLLSLYAAVPTIGVEIGLPEPLIALLIAAQLPLAHRLAVAGVSRARRGDTPDWLAARAACSDRVHAVPSEVALSRPDESGHYERSQLVHYERNPSEHRERAARAGRRFASAAAAQAWFEWRLNGPIFVGLVALMLPLVVVVVVIHCIDPNAAAPGRLPLLVFCVPLWLTAVATADVARFGEGSHALLVPSYLATRPLSTAGMAAAKLRLIARSLAVAYLVALAAAVKLLLAVWLLRVLLRRRLVETATVRRLAGAWLTAVAALLAVLFWLTPAGLLAWHTAAAAVVLAVPVIGIELAPLALAWNRHR